MALGDWPAQGLWRRRMMRKLPDMRRWWPLWLILPVLACGTAWWFREPVRAWLCGNPVTLGTGRAQAPRPDARTYAVLVAELERWRKDLAERHRRARGDEARAAIECDARIILEQSLPAMMRCWLGTPYDFNGTAARPGAGRIACGYFVATVLVDAGFRVDRYQLAKQPAENILRSFLEKDDCVLSVDKPYEEFAAELGHAGPGIHLLGLDTHVAFVIAAADGEFRVIHASGSRPWCVVEEGRNEAGVVQRSKWRMLGNLTANPGVIRRWLTGGKIVVRTT
jgi:hypothetical protein